MVTTRIAAFILLSLPIILNGQRAELSVAPGDSVRSSAFTIQGASPNSRLELIDGVHPMGVVVTDDSGIGHLAAGSLPPGSHSIRAVEWGTGRSSGETLHFLVPPEPANSFDLSATDSTGIHPLFVATGDIDGDGSPSVILGSAEGVSLLRNSRGILSAPVRMAEIPEPTAIVLQDFNGDGRNDVAITSADGRVTVLLNRGDGRFGAPAHFSAGLRPSAVVSADFNGDGIPDLAISNQEGNDISILLGDGKGSFQPAPAIPTGYSPRSLVVADFNGDGLADLASVNFAGNNISILLGDGKSGFRDGGVYAAGNGPTILAVADFNEDGAPDLAVLNQLDQSVLVLINDGLGAFQAGSPSSPGAVVSNTRFRASARDATSLAVGDMDGDGHVDLLFQSGSEMRVWTGDGRGSFNPGYSAPVVGLRFLVAVDDFNGDGSQDAVAIGFDGSLTVLTGEKLATPLKNNGTSVAHSSVKPLATSVTMTFEGLRDLELVGNYYNGQQGGSGSGPGPNYGVAFGAAAQAVISSLENGSGNFINEPSCCTAMKFLSTNGLMMNVTTGFTTSMSFYYAAPTGSGTVTVYSGLNGSGAALGSANLTTTSTNCGGGEGLTALTVSNTCWQLVTITFNGTAQSVAFVGSAGIFFDNITLTNVLPQKLIITTTSLPDGSVGAFYSQTLAAINGITPYTWSSSTPPPGLTLSPQGVLSGTPTATGIYILNITVTDKSNPQLTGTTALTLTITQNTSTSLVVSPNPSVQNSTVTLVAIVLPTSAGGTVQFMDGNATLSIVPLSNGVAILQWSTFSAGTHSLVAVYSGGLANFPSVSPTWIQTVVGTLCTYSITPSSASVIAAASTGSVAVTAPAGCQWTATSNSSNIVGVASGAQGSGNGTVTYNVSKNSGSARTGTLTIANQTFTLTQAASTTNCSYALTQSSQTFPSGGSSGNLISVITQGGCPWSASSNVPWLTPVGGGPGNGTVTYGVQSNSSNATRHGLLTIAGQTYVVTQLGTSSTTTCTASVPKALPVALEGRTETVGNLVLTCNGLASTVTADIVLTLNTPVTNTVGISDPLLMNGNGVQHGQLLGYTTVHWPGVTLVPNSGTATVTITNVLADASSLSSGSNLQSTMPITGQLTVNSGVALPVANGTLTVANAASTLTFQAAPPAALAQAIMPITYQEVTSSAFNVTSGTTQATRFRFVISGLPSDVELYAPIAAVSGAAQASLFSADCSGAGGSAITTGISVAGVTYSQLVVTGGVATATWVVQSVTSNIDTLTFPMLVFNPDGVSLNGVQIEGSLAPVSPPGAACGSTDPSATAVPRYRDFTVPLTTVSSRLTTSIKITQSNQAPALKVEGMGEAARVRRNGSTLEPELRVRPLVNQPTVTAQANFMNESTTQPMTNAKVGVSAPTGTNQMSCTASLGGSCPNPGNGQGTCLFPSIAAQQTVTCTASGALDSSYPPGSSATTSAGASSVQAVIDYSTDESSSTTTVFGPPELQIELPSQNSTLTGTVMVEGWALDQYSAIGNVQILVDNIAVGTAAWGQAAPMNPNICGGINAEYPDWFGCPTIAFTYLLNTNLLGQGPHMITAVATNTDANPTSSTSAGVAVTVNLEVRGPVVVLRDQVGSIRLGNYASASLSNSGGIFGSDPSAAQDETGNTYVTARDKFNSVWANTYNAAGGTWSGWKFAGGIIQGVPSIAVDTSGVGWIASRDSFNSYWLLSYSGGGVFGSWIPLLGIFSTDPVVTTCWDGSVYVIGKDVFNSLWSGQYIPGTGFQGWSFGGGIIKGKPSATCGSDNAVYIAAEDNFNSNWMARVAGKNWGTWYFGGAITSVTPRIATLGNGSEAVMILDSTGVVYQTTYMEGTGNGWQKWSQLGGVLQDVVPMVGNVANLYLAGEAPDGGLWWWKQNGNQWTGIGNAGVAAGQLAGAPK